MATKAVPMSNHRLWCWPVRERHGFSCDHLPHGPSPRADGCSRGVVSSHCFRLSNTFLQFTCIYTFRSSKYSSNAPTSLGFTRSPGSADSCTRHRAQKVEGGNVGESLFGHLHFHASASRPRSQSRRSQPASWCRSNSCTWWPPHRGRCPPRSERRHSDSSPAYDRFIGEQGPRAVSRVHSSIPRRSRRRSPVLNDRGRNRSARERARPRSRHRRR